MRFPLITFHVFFEIPLINEKDHTDTQVIYIAETFELFASHASHFHFFRFDKKF